MKAFEAANTPRKGGLDVLGALDALEPGSGDTLAARFCPLDISHPWA